MDKFEENQIKIASYLDNQMTAAEEESFMQELSNDAELRKQYEEELMISGLLQHGEIQNNEAEKNTPLVSFWRKYKIAAIVVAVIISIALLYKLDQREKYKEEIARRKSSEKSVIGNDSTGKQKQSTPDEKNFTEEIFSAFYKSYSGETDPVEISNYYNDYKARKYESVIAAKESDYQAMGADDKKELLKQYMHLYKGLSWLEMDEPEKAVEEFGSITKTSLQNKTPYYEGEWYSCLARIKLSDTAKASLIAKKISESKSPHRTMAEELLKKLNQK